MFESPNNFPLQNGDNLRSNCGSVPTKGQSFSGGSVPITRESSRNDCATSQAQQPSTNYVPVVVNQSDNIWRDENMSPVLSEGDEIYVIDNA